MNSINLNEVKAMLQSEDQEAHSFVRLLLTGSREENKVGRSENKLRRVRSNRHFEHSCHTHQRNADFAVHMGPQNRPISRPDNSIMNEASGHTGHTDHLGCLKRTSSAPIPIPNFVSYDDGLEELEERVKYDRATWNMYHRITSHRRSREHLSDHARTGGIVNPSPSFPCLPEVRHDHNTNEFSIMAPQFPMS